MRDILEDAEGAAARGDIGPGKSNREHDARKFPKRFYKEASASRTSEGFSIELDGKPVKTPGRNTLLMPTNESAELVVDEWNNVDDRIIPLKMPCTRLANTAVDGVAHEMQAVMEDIIRYAGSDLLCYRAETPQGLIEKQDLHWNPVLDWCDAEAGAVFETGSGIMHVPQSKKTIAAFSNRLARHETPFRLAALHTITSITGSALIALALAENAISSEQGWNAAHVDEDWNISQWGEDWEAKERREQRFIDYGAAYRLLLTIPQAS